MALFLNTNNAAKAHVDVIIVKVRLFEKHPIKGIFDKGLWLPIRTGSFVFLFLLLL